MLTTNTTHTELTTNTQSKNWIINRHPATVEWFKHTYRVQATTLDYLDEQSLTLIKNGDTLLGNLPLQEIAKLCAKGVNYYEIRIPVAQPTRLRGQELNLEQLKQHPPVLTQYVVQSISNRFSPPTSRRSLRK